MNIPKSTKILFLCIASLLPVCAFAHQPRITENRQTIVVEPEISKAYYGKLTGEPDVYLVDSSTAFDLYVNILVPDIAGQKKDVSAAIIRDGDTDNPVAVLEGTNFDWKKFYEPFGADTYWMGPEYKTRAEAGRYEIRVWSSNNDSKYSLAVGEIEAFDMKEGLNAIAVIPRLKKDFFDASPAWFILSPMGFGFILIMYLFAGIIGFAYRLILRRFAGNSPRGVSKNIGNPGRLLRFVIGIALLLWAILTTWSPIPIFFSGFCFFEAAFSWCGFYAAIGKNTCPIN